LKELDNTRLSPEVQNRVSSVLDDVFATSINGFLDWEIEEKEIWGDGSPLRYGGSEFDTPSMHSFLRSIPAFLQVGKNIDTQV
jgi:hypothetical protein